MVPGDSSAKRDPPLLDVRPEGEFHTAHASGAASIALEDLSLRTHELPPADQPLRVTDADPARARAAAEFLCRRGHSVRTIPFEAMTLVESGPSRVRLWRANPFLVESLGRIRFDLARKPWRALDVACGSGRDAVCLALHGYNVLAVDLLPDALDRAGDLARRSGVTISTAAMDVESGPSLPAGSYDLVTVFRFLHRPLWPLLRQAVAPGGLICYETFHEQNRTTGRRPNDPAHLLSTGELTAAFSEFEILIARDAVEREGRFFSSLLARRPAQ
jgi:SAM-dependent methyltransferase